MTWENGPTLAQLAAQERKQRRTRPLNPLHKVTFGIGAFSIGALVWVTIFPIPAMLFILSNPIASNDYDGGLAVIGVPSGLAIGFGIPSAITILITGRLLARVRHTWIHITAIAAVSGLTTLLILLALIPLGPGRTFVLLTVSLTAVFAAGAGRLAANGMVRLAS